MKFIINEIKPQSIKIAGAEYPAIFSFAAMAAMEEKLGLPYGKIITKLAQNDLQIGEFAAVICCCMRAAGVEVEESELMSVLDVGSAGDLYLQLVDLINGQSPDGEGEKKGKK